MIASSPAVRDTTRPVHVGLRVRPYAAQQPGIRPRLVPWTGRIRMESARQDIGGPDDRVGDRQGRVVREHVASATAGARGRSGMPGGQILGVRTVGWSIAPPETMMVRAVMAARDGVGVVFAQGGQEPDAVRIESRPSPEAAAQRGVACGGRAASARAVRCTPEWPGPQQVVGNVTEQCGRARTCGIASNRRCRVRSGGLPRCHQHQARWGHGLIGGPRPAKVSASCRPSNGPTTPGVC